MKKLDKKELVAIKGGVELMIVVAIIALEP